MTLRPIALSWLLLATVPVLADDPARSSTYDPADDDTTVEELVVTARRMPSLRFEEIGNISSIQENDVAATGSQHPSQIVVRVPGAWVARGSGQEHLTAIRSPVLTGAGSCGAFLVLEDGIPTRPAGFCNVNQLMELPMAMARGIEIIRGPAGAPYGANGLHGVINVLLPGPGDGDRVDWRTELGPDHYLRSMAIFDTWDGSNGLAVGVSGESYGGFRHESGHDQARGYVRGSHEAATGHLEWGLSGSYLDQETGGLITGQDAWRDPTVAAGNPNPEAYRNARSGRAHLRWTGSGPVAARSPAVDARVYGRYSDMEFLQHFLPGQPVENNDQLSGGLMLGLTWDSDSKSSLQAGLEIEGARGSLREFQTHATQGSAFLVATRPQGLHYDFDVDTFSAAAFTQYQIRLRPEWSLRLGARVETLRYDYDNLASDGNLRDDGTACGFGGCLYTRPIDSSESFTSVAPNIGLLYRPTTSLAIYASAVRGFRPPQATELYRLQSGQTKTDLDTEELDSQELGLRYRQGRLRLELAAFHMRKNNFIFRDAQGFNVSDGKTRHAGVELELSLTTDDGFYAHVAATAARHTYRFDRAASRGEQIISGALVDTAPERLGSARAGWAGTRTTIEAEWIHHGDYWLDAANTARYEGHDLANLRLSYRLNRAWKLTMRINNLFDRRYAERADFAFGSYRYSPGREREFFVGFEFRRPRND